jgi:hypothetical protein
VATHSAAYAERYHQQHYNMPRPGLLISAALLIASAWANNEKAVFLGPPAVTIPSTPPTLGKLHINTLNPDNGSVRTYLEAQFPSDSLPWGKPTWLLLDQLTEGKRYEVRVCWSATVSWKSDVIRTRGTILITSC